MKRKKMLNTTTASLSVMAQFGTLLGGGLSNGAMAQNYDNNSWDVLPMDGSGGGTIIPTNVFAPGGTFSLEASSTTNSTTVSFSITTSVTCNGPGDRVNCIGWIFLAGGDVITGITHQDVCSSFTRVFTLSSSFDASLCQGNATAALNMECLNQTTLTALTFASGNDATIDCA